MMESGLSPSDVLAITAGNEEHEHEGGGYGNMWNNPFVYLVWIWAFSAFGGNGFGGNRNASEALTRSDLCQGFNFQNVENGIRGIQNGLCDGFYALNNTALQGFHGVDNALCQGFNNVNQNISQARFDAQQCCCETNRNIDAVRYENAKNTCDVITSGTMNTRDIIDSQNAGFQRVIDFMTNDKIESLRTELQAAQLALQNNAQTQTLVNELKPCPIPAYITCSPYAAHGAGFNGFNNGCGCGCG